MAYQFYNPTRVLFGAGQLNHLHEQTMPGKKAMVVISNGKSTRANGALDRTLEQLHMAGVETVLFDKVGANPLKAVVEEGGRFAKDNGCDFVVALGGGSVMDAAKVMAMYALQPGDLWDYVAGSTGKMQPLVNPTLPVIAITTTAGTGSEVDQWGVVTNPETNEKIGCGGQDSLFPVLAVVDPELMRTVPPKFTAYQGFDALFHSTEGYISAVTSPMADMVQLAAIENIGKYLARGEGRQRHESPRACRVREHDVRLFDGCRRLHQRARDGARHERVPSGAAARRGAYHDLQGVLYAFCQQALLRRALCPHGAGAGQGGRKGPDGLRGRAGRAAAGLRRGRPQDVRLRHPQGRVHDAGEECPRHDGRPVRR